MRRLISLSALVGLLTCTSLLSTDLQAAPPDGLAVAIDEPATETAVRRLTFRLRARVTGAEPTKVEVVYANAAGREKAVALARFADGRWGGDAIALPFPFEVARVFVRAHGPSGDVARADVPIRDESGWKSLFPVMGAGSDAPPAMDVEALSGKRIELPARSGAPTLVVFYSTWDDCAREIAWAQQLRKRFAPKGLVVIGVGSVARDDVRAWRDYLEKHEADWENVVDVDGSIAVSYDISPRRAVGNAAAAPVIYFLHEGKVGGADFPGSIETDETVCVWAMEQVLR